MPKSRQRYQRTKHAAKKFKWRGLILIAVGLFVLAGGTFGVAASFEQKNSFCASCHSEPEQTHYNRSIAAQPVDMASWHTLNKGTLCIDCHSGIGVFGRVQAITTGAYDAVRWVTHTAPQPAPLTIPIGDSNCLKCHASVTQTTNFDRHFHNFLARWQAADPNAGTCVACHNGHILNGDTQASYIQDQQVTTVCQACHAVLGGGG